MELKTLLLGILFSVGLFAAKAGIGLQYFLAREDRRAKRVVAHLAFLGGYAVVFAVSAVWLRFADLPAYIEAARRFSQGGMLLHLALAALMLGWGVALLKAREVGEDRSFGWLLLVLPCPVCLTAIVISLAFLLAFFPNAAMWSVAALYGGFAALSFLTELSLTKWRRTTARSPESVLASAMVLVAAYFLLSVIVMPQFAELDEVYRLAVYGGRENESNIGAQWTMLAAQGLVFTAGFFAARMRMRRTA